MIVYKSPFVSLPAVCLAVVAMLPQLASAQIEYPPETHAIPIPRMESLPLKAGPFKGTVDSLEQFQAPDWFRDGKFGIWAHWGPQAVPGDGDWYARHIYEEGSGVYNDHVKEYGHPSKSGYKDIIPLWKAEKWDPDRLMALYKAAGAHYFVAQAVHHDNFDNWDSKYHKWNSVEMGPHKDMLALWQQAAKKQGLPFGFSEHLGHAFDFMQASHGADKNGPLAGVPYDGNSSAFWDLYTLPTSTNADEWYTSDPRWPQEWYARLYDAVTRYKPDLLYSDGGYPYKQAGLNIVAQLYNLSVQQHNGKLEAVYCCKKNYGNTDYYDGTCVQDVERGGMNSIQPFAWQTDTSTGDWYYNRHDHYKSSSEIIGTLMDIVSKNGNLLLNVVLYPDGSLPPEMQNFLSEMAAWTKVNGEAVFSTRPWVIYGEGPTVTKGGAFNENVSFTAHDLRFTRKGNDIYATTLGVPTGQVVIRALASGSPLATGEPTKVTLLGTKEDPKWSRTTDGLIIQLPAALPCKSALSFKISGFTSITNLAPDVLTAFTEQLHPEAMVVPDPDGSILLPASEAMLHGALIRLEGGEARNIGWWQNPTDFASWKFKGAKPGTYHIFIDMGSQTSDSELTIEVASERMNARSEDTGGWDQYQSVDVGTISIKDGGITTINVKPRSAETWKPINIRSVRLTPAP